MNKKKIIEYIIAGISYIKIVNSYIAQFENYIQTIKESNLNFQK